MLVVFDFCVAFFALHPVCLHHGQKVASDQQRENGVERAVPVGVLGVFDQLVITFLVVTTVVVYEVAPSLVKVDIAQK